MNSIQVEQKDAVARVILNRPPLNVLDIAALNELSAAFRDLKGPESKVVVLAAQGKAFSAGVDVKDHTADKVEAMMAAMRGVFEALWDLEQPTVAVVQGAALGGGMELAIGCDFLIASQDGKFGQPEIQVGVFPPIACLLLPRMLPWPKALELILTGDSISTEEAYRLGLVNRAVPADQLEKEANAFIDKLAGLSGPVLKLAKRATLCGFRERRDWQGALDEIERLYLDELMKLEDAEEGLMAFMEKRKPRWKER